MNSFYKIEKLLMERGSITTREASELGVHRSTMANWARIGKLNRISKGVYALPSEIPDYLYNLQLRCKRGVYSHETALYLHGLSDRTPLVHVMTVPKGYNVSSFKNDPVKFRWVETKYYDIGIIDVKTAHGNTIKAYNLERTICDIIRHRNKMDPAILNAALRDYTKSSTAKLSLLNIYSKQLGIYAVLKKVMGVLF